MKKKNKLKFNQLNNAILMAAKEDQIIWAIFGVFWAANAVLLVALFTEGQRPDYLVGAIISLVGIILSINWYLIQLRAINWLKYYEKLIEKIEAEIGMPKEFSISACRNRTLYFSTVGNGIRVRTLMLVSGIVSSSAWTLSFLIFLINFWCS